MSSEKWEAKPCDCSDPRCKSKVLWDRGLRMSLPMEADYAEARARELNAHDALVETLRDALHALAPGTYDSREAIEHNRKAAAVKARAALALAEEK